MFAPNLFSVYLHIVFVGNKQYILRLQIRVRQLILVQKLASVNKLPAYMPHLRQRVRLIVVVLHKVEDGRPQEIEGDANVAVEVEPVEHLNAEEFRVRIFVRQFVKDVYF